MALRPEQVTRYARHLLLSDVGPAGQLQLLDSRARVTGDGRAAEEAARYLVAAGVGRVSVAGTLHTRLIGELAAMNPDVTVTTGDESDYALLVTPESGDDRLSGALAAHGALVQLSGAKAGDFTWTVQPLETHAWH